MLLVPGIAPRFLVHTWMCSARKATCSASLGEANFPGISPAPFSALLSFSAPLSSWVPPSHRPCCHHHPRQRFFRRFITATSSPLARRPAGYHSCQLNLCRCVVGEDGSHSRVARATLQNTWTRSESRLAYFEQKRCHKASLSDLPRPSQDTFQAMPKLPSLVNIRPSSDP